MQVAAQHRRRSARLEGSAPVAMPATSRSREVRARRRNRTREAPLEPSAAAHRSTATLSEDDGPYSAPAFVEDAASPATAVRGGGAGRRTFGGVPGVVGATVLGPAAKRSARARAGGARAGGARRKRGVSASPGPAAKGPPRENRKLSPERPKKRLKREAAALLDGKAAFGGEDESCVVCLQTLVPECMKDRLRGGACKTEKLPCGHSFHFGCIKEWTKRQQRCPVCRADCPVVGRGPLPEKPLGSPPAGYLYSRRDFRLGEHGPIVQELVESGLLDSHPGVALQRLHASGVHIPLVSEEALSEAERLEQQIVNRAREGPRSFRIFGMRYVSAQVSGGVLEVIGRALAELRDLAKQKLWVAAFTRIEGLTRLMEDFDEWTAEADIAVQAVVGICSLTWVTLAMGVARTARARSQIQNFGDALKHGAAIIERMHDHCGMGEARNCPLLRAHTRFLNAFAKASAPGPRLSPARGAAPLAGPAGGSACAPLPALRRALQQLEEPSLMELFVKGASGLVEDLEEVWEIAHTTGALTLAEHFSPVRPASAASLSAGSTPTFATSRHDTDLRSSDDAVEAAPLPFLMSSPMLSATAGPRNATTSWERHLDEGDSDDRDSSGYEDNLGPEGRAPAGERLRASVDELRLPYSFLQEFPAAFRRVIPAAAAAAAAADRNPREPGAERRIGDPLPLASEMSSRRGTMRVSVSTEVILSMLRRSLMVDEDAPHHRRAA